MHDYRRYQYAAVCFFCFILSAMAEEIESAAQSSATGRICWNTSAGDYSKKLPSKLLSDNEGLCGERIFTGATDQYSIKPTIPAGAIRGDGDVSVKYADICTPVAGYVWNLPDEYGWSIQGLPETLYHESSYKAYLAKIAQTCQEKILFSRWNPLERIESPRIPEANLIIEGIEIEMARNESEGLLLGLTNSTSKPLDNIGCSFVSPERNSRAGIKAELYAVGIVQTRRHGFIPRVLLSPENMPAAAHLNKYLVNAEVVGRFPKISLKPYETVMIYALFTTDETPAGEYKINLLVGGSILPFKVTVKKFFLPDPPVWNFAYQRLTAKESPFRDISYLRKEINCLRKLGVNVWQGFPSDDEEAKILAETGPWIFKEKGLPSDLIHKGYCGKLSVDEANEEIDDRIAEHIRKLVVRAEALKLTYKDWFVDLWDEPNKMNGRLFGRLAQSIHRADPQLQIYCNPCFWEQGTGFSKDEEIVDALTGWYNELINISVPAIGLTQPANKSIRPKAYERFFASPRSYRAFYTHPCPGRSLAWHAAELDWNGFAFYSYYAPRSDPWNDMDGVNFDYQVVYPGPKEPILTLEYEQMREGWDDFRLLKILRENQKTQFLRELFSSKEAFGKKRESAMIEMDKLFEVAP